MPHIVDLRAREPPAAAGVEPRSKCTWCERPEVSAIVEGTNQISVIQKSI